MKAKANTRALTALVKQMDELLPTLSGKDAANLLIEKSAVIRDIAKSEQAAEAREAAALAEEQAKKIAGLESELAQAREQIKILERTSITKMLAAASATRTPVEAIVKSERKPIVHEPAKPTTLSELQSCGVPMPDAAPIPLSPPKKEVTLRGNEPAPTPLPENYSTLSGEERLRLAKASVRGTN